MTQIAASYYYQEILKQLLHVNLPIRERCRNAYLLFQEFLKEETSDAGVYLSGSFAKLHHLFENRKSSDELIYIGLNDYRVRMEQLSITDEAVLRADFPYDMLRFARFIAWRKEEAIPETLKERLPQLLPEVKRSKGRFLGNFRVVVLEKYEDHLLVYCINEGYEQKVRLKSLVDNNCDFSALLPLIAPNTNLNLVEVKWVEEAFEPTFIVLEPDFLIPVTTIAKCFVACGASAQYEVVNRLQPSFVNANILLGNFAGQMLDEELHGHQYAYVDSIRSFFTQNAVQC